MSARMYDLLEGNLALFVVDGEASFENVVVKTLEPATAPTRA